MGKSSDAEWKDKLTPEQYKVLRQCGTDPPFTGQYVHVKKPGEYACAACGNVLFDSSTKYESGSGWPSFYDVIEAGRVTTKRDWSLGLPRTEVRCANCDGHLGHVFDDGPQPTGQRYCINSTALKLMPREETAKSASETSTAE